MIASFSRCIRVACICRLLASHPTLAAFSLSSSLSLISLTRTSSSAAFRFFSSRRRRLSSYSPRLASVGEQLVGALEGVELLGCAGVVWVFVGVEEAGLFAVVAGDVGLW